MQHLPVTQGKRAFCPASIMTMSTQVLLQPYWVGLQYSTSMYVCWYYYRASVIFRHARDGGVASVFFRKCVFQTMEDFTFSVIFR